MGPGKYTSAQSFFTDRDRGFLDVVAQTRVDRVEDWSDGDIRTRDISALVEPHGSMGTNGKL